jgi:dipeptidyl aminopeptidase/acylaminoacyl peptidase
MKRACLCLVFALAVTLVPATRVSAQSSKHPISHEDVWLMKRIGTPAVSPDGRWAVVSVSEPSYDEKDQSSDLWIAATDGGTPPRRLTATKAAESGTAWSPDGARIAFATRRDGDEVSQIYVLEIGQPGEAQRVTSLSTGARMPLWRPDGKAILFNSDVYPGAATDEANRKAAAERKARKWNAHVYDTFPIRDWDRWLDDRRPSLFVQELAPGAEAKDILATAAVAAGGASAGSKGNRLTSLPGFGGQMGSGSESMAAAWRVTGDKNSEFGVVFVATANRNDAAFADTVQSLWLLEPAKGEISPTPNAGSFSDPAVSRNGATIFARIEPSTGRTYNAARLWHVSAGTGTAGALTSTFDRSVGSYVVAPDGRHVYFLAEDSGRQRLYVVSVDGGPVAEVGALTAGTYSSFHLAGPASAPVAVAVWESAVNPPELVRIDLATGGATPLSHFNTDRAAVIDWQPLREFWFTSAKGRRIHNFVALPPAFDPAKKYPLFVVIHGGPASQWMDQFVIRWNYHLLASPGYVVLLTNYTGSTGFGEAFSQAIQGDPLDTPGREILEAVDEAIRRYPFIDGARMAAGGASYGGHLANWLAVSTPRFKALVSHAGLFDQVSQWTTSDITYSREVGMGGPVWEKLPLWQTQNPIMRSANLKTPVLVSVGERDFRVPMNNALQYWSILQRQKVPSRLIVFPDENHWVLRGENSRFFYGEIRTWLAKWLE